MKAFEFDHRLIDSYARFSRSFSAIRSEDLKAEIDRQYDAGRFWPDALLSINPRFLQGPTVDDLVASGDLDEATGKIFRFGPAPLRFHRHQAQSIAKARAGQSYVVTTPAPAPASRSAFSCRWSTRSFARAKPANVLFEDQLEDPSAPGHRLYPTRFCRECGHEVHVVTRTEDADGILFLPRNIDDAPLDDQEGEAAGYLIPTRDGDTDTNRRQKTVNTDITRRLH